ncbi:MAG: FAD-binding oxidoreductase [Candidatus Firestonebacteria bacterium]|nr:FAD-binding oxidoreductase [Candidatus Firestonebacteria bacterium]
MHLIGQIDNKIPNFSSSQDVIKPFESDGCSLFPDGTYKNKNLWCDCCLNHDIAYWKGGTFEERLQADKALRDCILEKTGDLILAEIVYKGVRFGGSWIFPTWYRWGYGWSYGRGYKALSEEEKKMTERKLEDYNKSNKPYICDKK